MKVKEEDYTEEYKIIRDDAIACICMEKHIKPSKVKEKDIQEFILAIYGYC